MQTAVDDRRHDTVDSGNDVVTHLAVAMSARDLHDAVKERCPKKKLYHPYSGCGSSFGLIMHQYVLLLNILENLKIYFMAVNSDSLISMHTTQVQYSGTKGSFQFAIKTM